ncbi:MAG: hypothetical protein ABFD98_01435 [Syntrophobacteraceae bacterium]|nr:hypothetical protein [Desulfobacteraceae bacterium]
MEHRVMKAIAALVLLGGVSACAQTQVPPPTPVPPANLAPLYFPPQKAMSSGDYAGFLAENLKALKEGGGESGQDVALFNIGFVYAYSKSPYYNVGRALKIFDQLIRKHPESPWSFQARAWTDMLRKTIVAEEKHRKLRGKVKSKEAEISSKEAEITSKEAEINSKEAEINDLQNQLDRSRQIDVEMDRKERELLK